MQLIHDRQGHHVALVRCSVHEYIFSLLACPLLSRAKGYSWHASRSLFVQRAIGAINLGEQIIAKTYKGKEAEATINFQADAAVMGAQGYFPVFQSWEPGQWQSRTFITVLLLCFLIVGIPALVYMLIVSPDGALTVTYVSSTGDPTPEGALRPQPSYAERQLIEPETAPARA